VALETLMRKENTIPDTDRCGYDSGSMYGCYPVCDGQATHVVVYRNGTSGPFRAPVCPRHLQSMKGRAYPGLIETVALASRA
jgi:hypothetical protein